VTAYPDALAEARSPRRAQVLNLHATVEALVTVALLAVLVAAPALFSRATINDLGQAVCLGLFAISFNILFKYSGLLSFGHAAFFGFAAYTQALLLQSFAGLPVPLLILATGLSASVLGYLIGQICVRRSGAYFSMTTLAIAALFYAVAFKWHAATGGTDGLDSFMPSSLMLLPRWHLDSPGISETYLLVLAILIPVAVAAWALLELTPFGSAVVAVKHNEKRAAFLGYDTHRVKLANFTLAAGLAGVAGALWAIDNSFVSTDSIDLSFSTTVVIIAFLGGSVWFWGPLIGAVVYIAASDWLSALTPHWQIWLGLAFILVVLFAPGGIAGLVKSLWRLALRRQAAANV
jgi:ABC-type branched-subunit amino acid transport system permease subunit